MVGHHIGRGHQNGGHAKGRHLTEGAGTGTADDQIGGGHHHRHVVDVLPHVQHRAAESALFQLAGDMGPIALSGGVNVVEGEPGLPLLLKEVQHPLVHGGRAQTAPEGGHQRLIVSIAQLLPGLLFRQLKEIAPHRRAGDHHLVGVLVMAAAILKAHHHAVHAVLQQFGGQTGDHVGLVYGGGDAVPGGGLDSRIAGIAAGAHHQIGLEIADDGVGLPAGGHQRSGGLEVVPQAVQRKRAAEVADFNGGEVIARLFHKAPLHTVGSAHKQHSRGGILLLHIPRQRQRRVHMSGGAAAGKDHIHSK